jgi:hypothetical protein
MTFLLLACRKQNIKKTSISNDFIMENVPYGPEWHYMDSCNAADFRYYIGQILIADSSFINQ